MADTKISALTDGNPAQSGDEIPIARSGANYKITAGSIASLASAGGVTVNTTTITGGTSGRILYDNAGTVGEKAVTGSGDVVLATSPTLVTPALGTPSSVTLTNATGLPIGGLTGLGTGVGTALAVNVGTAGAFVVNGGALGTPSSGTLTSATGLPISTGVSGLGTNVATALAVNVGSSGAVVVNGGALGTPSSGTLTNATGLPVSTGISGLGTGVATFLATPSSSNLAAAITDETGSGSLVFATSPSLTTPNLGTPSALTLTNATGLPVGGISATGTPGSTTYLRGDGSWQTVSASPGGSNTQVQYNSSGSFAGDANFTYDGAGWANLLGLELGTTTTPGEIDLRYDGGTVVAIVPQDGASWTLTLPSSAGTNGYVLQTDGSGTTSWVAQSGGGGGITIGTTTITSGTSGRILYNNAGVTGEKAVTGSGDVVLATSPTLVTPALGTPSSGTLTNCTGLPVGGISATGTPSSSTFLQGDGVWTDKVPKSDTTGITGADQITNIISLTAAEYAAIGTKSATTLYIVT